jgi:hypothetical protein
VTTHLNYAKTFKVEIDPTKKNLPTAIIFQKGAEICRFPPYKSSGKFDPKILRFNRKALEEYLQLEQKFKELGI